MNGTELRSPAITTAGKGLLSELKAPSRRSEAAGRCSAAKSAVAAATSSACAALMCGKFGFQ